MVWVSAGFLIGLALGSFTKVLADRSLKKQSFWGRSYCLYCKKKLQWYDLFPILSFISTGGKCRYCHKRLSIEYLLVEIVMGVLVGFLFWQNPFNFSAIGGPASGWQLINLLLNLIFKTFFIIILAVLFLTDLKKMFIPDRIILPSLLIGFILSLAITIFKVSYLYYFLRSSPIGKFLLPPYSSYFLQHALLSAWPFLSGILMSVIIGGFFWGLIIITKGKGMGGGDVKLGAFMGLMLGFPQALLALILSFLTGAIFSIVLIIFGKKHFGQSIPFGPFLVLGSLIALFWGNQILNWYLTVSSGLQI